MQFQNCTKTGLTQNFVYSKRHCLRFVLESILRKQRPTVWVKSQLRACVENAGARRSRICDSIPLLAVSHEMTWDPTLDSGSHLIPCEQLENAKLEFCQRPPHANLLPPPASSPAPTLNDAFSKPHICDCLYCAFPWNNLGATRGDWEEEGGVCREATKAFRTPGIFLLISLQTPSAFLLRRDICSSADSRTKIFSPKLPLLPLPCSWRCACVRATRSYEATKFKQDTQGCQKIYFKS